MDLAIFLVQFGPNFLLMPLAGTLLAALFRYLRAPVIATALVAFEEFAC